MRAKYDGRPLWPMEFKPIMTNRLFIAAALLAITSGGAVVAADGRLTLERLYSTDEFKAETLRTEWFGDNGAFTTLAKNKEDGADPRIVLHYPDSAETETLVSSELLTPSGSSSPLDVERYAFSEDRSLVLVYTNSKRVWRQNTRGDYWLLDRSSRQLTKLGGDVPPSSLMFAKISPGGRRVAYVHERNIYVEEVDDHSIRKLTETPTEEIINGTFDWVYEEELGLRDGFRWSPDGGSIAYWQLDTTGVSEVPLVNNTDSLYPKVIWIPYPKVGQQNSASRVGVADVGTGETRWMQVPGDSRNQYIARMQWAGSSERLLLQVLNRAQNENHVILANALSGATREVFVEKDDAWVDAHDETLWLDEAKEITWISERDGWRHAYRVLLESGDVERITTGEFDVIRLLWVGQDEGWAYLQASPGDATRQYLYRVRLNGSRLERLTPNDAQGWHEYEVAPNGEWAIHTVSTIDDPPRVELISLPDHRVVETLVTNDELRLKMRELDSSPTQFFQVEIEEGVELDAWSIEPRAMESDKSYPLLVHVYGEPAGRTVADRWSPRHHLWHVMLAQQGYVVMSFDNRGTKVPKGRAWRKTAFQKIGVVAPREQAAAVRKILLQRPDLDPERVAVWGWSGGGSMSLNAIFKYPDLYQTAIAVAPVPNQRYYDSIYQERYMGRPEENPDGFLEGSPINFADQLQGNLLLIHGTGDDNCHYQTTEMLINELIHHNKPFTMMSYPNRTHAIREGENTTRHLRELMTRYLQEHVPQGGRTRGGQQ